MSRMPTLSEPAVIFRQPITPSLETSDVSKLAADAGDNFSNISQEEPLTNDNNVNIKPLMQIMSVPGHYVNSKESSVRVPFCAQSLSSIVSERLIEAMGEAAYSYDFKQPYSFSSTPSRSSWSTPEGEVDYLGADLKDGNKTESIKTDRLTMLPLDCEASVLNDSIQELGTGSAAKVFSVGIKIGSDVFQLAIKAIGVGYSVDTPKNPIEVSKQEQSFWTNYVQVLETLRHSFSSDKSFITSTVDGDNIPKLQRMMYEQLPQKLKDKGVLAEHLVVMPLVEKAKELDLVDNPKESQNHLFEMLEQGGESSSQSLGVSLAFALTSGNGDVFQFTHSYGNVNPGNFFICESEGKKQIRLVDLVPPSHYKLTEEEIESILKMDRSEMIKSVFHWTFGLREGGTMGRFLPFMERIVDGFNKGEQEAKNQLGKS